jgi:hypothetical protein
VKSCNKDFGQKIDKSAQPGNSWVWYRTENQYTYWFDFFDL